MSDWQYKINEECEESIYDLPKLKNHNPLNSHDCEMAASEAIKEHHYNHDGWEHDLPYSLRVELIYKDKSIGEYDCDAEPDIYFSFGKKVADESPKPIEAKTNG